MPRSTRDDPVLGEWDVAIVSPHFTAALLARDLGDTGPEMDRMFEYALTYRRDTVVRAAHSLMSRVVPRVAGAVAATPARTVPTAAPAVVVPAAAGQLPHDGLLERALGAATSGVTIADMTRPDSPLVFVNAAFETLAGFRLDELLGRNCRFLQGPDSDAAAVARIRTALAEGRECRELVLNYRGPHREPWWNEVHLSPVTDQQGRVVQYIGVQNDVTQRVEAERALRQETDRARAYLARIEQLAYTDSLTGLMNRRRFEERVEAELWEAQAGDSAVALLFLDLDGFKAVNDSLGHGAGDELLQELAERLRRSVRRSDLLARLGGDEFLVAVTGLDPDTAAATARDIADVLQEAVRRPLTLRDREVAVAASIGISVYPHDAQDFGRLLHAADLRMYELKDRPRA